MDQNYLALKLLLDELNISPEIKTVAERKTLQKAVYLGQAAGVDLGYRYNWYRMGPYSPGLTRDYFGLADALEGGETAEGYELQRGARANVDRAKTLFVVPAGVSLDFPDWLELLASVHFLRTRRRLSLPQARVVLNEEKQHVAKYAEVAAQTLQDEGLVDAA